MSHHFRLLLLASTTLTPLCTSPTYANPLGGQVVGGSANIAGQGSTHVTVTQTTPSAIINWNTFNIGAGETTRFVQPGATSVILDRVTGGAGPSTLSGNLISNGQVFLVNPDGVLVGPTGKIQTGGFLATTHDISNADFMAVGYYNGALQSPTNPDYVGQILGPNSNSGAGTGIPLTQILVRPTLTGDLNGDGVVNSYDVTLFNTFGLFNQPTNLGYQAGDLNGDGVVDSKDVAIFNSAGNFGNGVYS